VVAPRGLYRSDGNQQFSEDVIYEIETQQLDAVGTPIALTEETQQRTITGSETSQSLRADTLEFSPTYSAPFQVRIRRVSNRPENVDGTFNDEIKWVDCYAVTPVSQQSFGDVTTVHTQVYATAGAVVQKDRIFNLRAQRKIETRVSGDTFTATKSFTNRVDEILSHIAKAPTIGNRVNSEIDFDNIYDTVQAIQDHFGNDAAVKFNYTFDDDNLSFEETFALVAKAVFATAYRQGNQIKINAELTNQNSSLLFNHRNILPGSQRRLVRFGNQNGYDGVELEYTNLNGDPLTYHIPLDRSAINPLKIRTRS
jgi:hypothetical protein